ncbi:MAG TPA: penicillin-binding protein [Anaeromyxobacteraceae bacterium]|nr:penicillin-binding protein [Anaeromyxobacteraceae bacterium]
MAVVAVAFVAGFGAVAARAVRLQILEGPRYVKHGDAQWRRSVVLPPQRGVIADRSGQTVAASADAHSIAANPGLLARLDPGELSQLARALGLDRAALARKAQRPGKFVWLKRRVSAAESRAVGELDLPAVGVFPEARRYYTSALAAQLVGFVGDDGEGLEGIELAWDDALQGGSVRVPSVVDARGKSVLAEAPAPGAIRTGARVELALDLRLQLAAEQVLSRAVAQARAAGGMLVAMDPRTGEVLALAHAPSFNPNQPRRGAPMRNRAVLDTYEPGSTFKIFTLAGALDAGVLHARDAIDCEEGAWRVGGHVIHDHKKLGWVGPERIVVTSSNIGAAKIGARLGRERLVKTLLAFGFGERSGTEIPGEPRGAVPFPKAEVALATMSFGQGVAATPLQITSAVAAVANGGMLMRPVLVRRVVDPATGATVHEGEPTPVRRAVSRETAALLTRWLVAVIDDPDGTGKRARLDGWSAAGKTGTAQKADPVTHRYSADRRFSSFVGFAPAENPRIALGVFVDEPRGEVYGGEVAAPVFREVAEQALRLLGVPPSRPGAEAVAASDPAPPAEEEPPQPTFEEEADRRVAEGGGVAVPHLAGKAARSALRALEEAELGAEVKGSGRVVSQSPRAGEVVERGTRVRLVLAPPRP